MAESDVGCWINRPTPFHLLPAIKYFLSCCWITEWMEGWRQFFLLQHFLLVHSHLSFLRLSWFTMFLFPLICLICVIQWVASVCTLPVLMCCSPMYIVHLCLWVYVSVSSGYFCLWSEVVNVSFCNFPLPMVCMCNRHLNCACACAFVQPACALCMCRKHQKSAMWLSCNVMAVPHWSVQIGCSSFQPSRLKHLLPLFIPSPQPKKL